MRPTVYAAILTCLIAAAAVAQTVPDDPVLTDAIHEYNAGHVSKAVSLLMQDLRDKPDSGPAHYYLGLALKKGGADATAISEFESAIKLCPQGTLLDLAKQAYHGDFKEDPAQVSSGTTTNPPAKQDWWSGMISFFQPKPAAPTASTGSTPQSSFPSMDFFAPVKNAVKGAKDLVKQPQNKSAAHVLERVNVGEEAAVIPMGTMLRIAEESQGLKPSLQSDPSGVVVFHQAPEDTLEWDRWIGRFKRTMHNMVFKHIAKEATNEVGGTASMIFSVDNVGHLRASVYNATADDAMVKCLIESAQELDKSYLLTFPATSHTTGWNFRMRWNFGKALAYVKALRQLKAQILEAAKQRTTEQVNAKIKEQKTAAGLKAAAAKKLAEKKLAEKQAAAKLLASQVVVKTGVAGLILPKPKPLEMKAQQLKLSDMPPLPPAKLTDQDINDISIEKGDMTGLFH